VLKRLGYKIAVISGGFTYFTNHLKAELDLDYAYANELEVREGRLTGRLLGPIVDARRKADLLETIALGESISLDQVIAVGDGANDLQMLKKAGLGVAFNAKKSLREAAEHTIDGAQLDAILYLLGIRGQEVYELLEGQEL
jgi:phosphoserine phosphatase